MTGSDQNKGLAVVCSLSAMALFGLIDNLMRLAADTGSLWQFHLIRSIVALVVLYGAARVMKIGLRMQYPDGLPGGRSLRPQRW